jgi:hypothetical protein
MVLLIASGIISTISGMIVAAFAFWLDRKGKKSDSKRSK